MILTTNILNPKIFPFSFDSTKIHTHVARCSIWVYNRVDAIPKSGVRRAKNFNSLARDLYIHTCVRRRRRRRCRGGKIIVSFPDTHTQYFLCGRTKRTQYMINHWKIARTIWWDARANFLKFVFVSLSWSIPCDACIYLLFKTCAWFNWFLSFKMVSSFS